jgi:hypothetical protein
VILSDLSADDLTRRLRAGELAIRCGPFVVRIASPIPLMAEGLRLLYADYELSDGFADFRLELAAPGLLRRWIRPYCIFSADGEQPFAPYPLEQTFPLFEWSFNWCIVGSTHDYLIIHSAVVEREGRAVILPGDPGTGKSTLAAALVNRGWRLFSDELALIDLETRRLVPLPRPVSLKNRSIVAIRAFAPDVVLSAPTHNTSKGTISHMKVPTADVRRAGETAPAGWIVFPKYVAGAAATLRPHAPADAVVELANNAFNYRILGRPAFDALCDVVAGTACFDFEYGVLDDAVAAFESLLSRAPA